MLKRVRVRVRVICVMLAVIMVASVTTAQESHVIIEINQVVQNYEVAPILANGRVMVPMRAIFENLGAEVFWDDVSNIVTASKNDNTVVFKIGDNYAFINKVKKEMDTPAIIINGRTMVPIRFVSEALGIPVYWDEQEQKVSIGEGAEEAVKEIPHLNIIDVTAKGSDGNIPINTIDGNYGTRWSLEGVNCWIQFELETLTEVGYIGIAFYNGDARTTTFRLEVSENGVDFTEVFYGDSEMQLDMAPYSLQNKMAKYVRFVGFGNSANAWNSISEVKIYPKRMDGEMMVEKAGLDDGEAEEVDNLALLTPEQEKMFNSVLDTLKDAMLWAATMYDPKSGGFFYSQSAKDNPEILSDDLESTRQAINFLSTYGVLQYMPEDIKQGLITYFQQRQDPDTGYFVNPMHKGTTNARQLSRDLSCIGTLRTLGAAPLYDTPGQKVAKALLEKEEESEVKTDESSFMLNMPAYMESPQAYKDWIEGLQWDTHSWTAGDLLTNSPSYILQLPQEIASEYWDIAMKWLLENQNPQTGDWGTCEFGVNISGAYKIVHFLLKMPTENRIDDVYWFPNVDVLYANIMKNLPDYKHTSMLMTRNITDILIDLRGQIDHATLMNDLPDIFKYSYEDLLEYRFPDGSFSEKVGFSPASTGGGYNQGLGVAEGCMNVAASSQAILKMFNAFYGVRTPGFGEEFANQVYDVMREQY